MGSIINKFLFMKITLNYVDIYIYIYALRLLYTTSFFRIKKQKKIKCIKYVYQAGLGGSMQFLKQSFKGLKTILFSFALAAIFCLSATLAYAADEVIFCKSINENNEPVEPAAQFSTAEVAVVSRFSKPCGVPQIMFSVYRENDKGEEILYRETVDVRPEWNCFGTNSFVFPGDGIYTLAFNHLGGELIAEGTVTIDANIAPEEAEPFPEKIEMEGKSLEALFNQFKVSAQPK